MNFNLKKSLEILERTPIVIESYLSDLSEEWIYTNEGEGTWSPYDIIGHLIHGEKTDWIERAKIIIYQQGDRILESFDRFAQFKDSQGKSLAQLIEEFKFFKK